MPQLIQETHLVNNWYGGPTQGFNTIAGIASGNLVFTQARTPFTTEIPMFSYNLNSVPSCFSPSVIIAVPRTATETHIVWNRTGATEYRVRFRPLNGSVWSVKVVSGSFVALKNLLPASGYEYQVRAVCNGIFSPWSEANYFNTGTTYTDYNFTVLADRPESASVHRIYWLQTQYITSVRIRYRPAGTVNWTVVGNSDGMLRITGLQPHTLYEYQYKPMINGIWDAWYPSTLYFMTDEMYLRAAPGDDAERSKNEITISPNPAADFVTLSGEVVSAKYSIMDFTGRSLKEGFMQGNTISVEGLPPGIYFLKTEEHLLRFVKL